MFSQFAMIVRYLAKSISLMNSDPQSFHLIRRSSVIHLILLRCRSPTTMRDRGGRDYYWLQKVGKSWTPAGL